MLNRRAITAAALSALLPAAARAQAAWPEKPIRVIVPFGPGGLADVTMRLVGEKLGQKLGQPVLIDNKPGAGGATAAAAAMSAPADGYTLALLTNGTAVSAGYMKNMGFNPVADFMPVSSLGFFDFLIVTSAEHPYKTLGELIAAAKAKPDTLNIGTINIGSTQNLSAVLLNSLAGIKTTIVPYKTTPDALTSLLRKDVDVVIDGYSAAGRFIKDGKMRALATSGAARSPHLPDVPTAIEQGVAGFDVTSWNAVFAPKGTPPAVIAKLNAEIAAAVADPEVKAKLANLGIEARASTPQDIGDKLKSDIARWTAVVDKAGIVRE